MSAPWFGRVAVAIALLTSCAGDDQGAPSPIAGPKPVAVALRDGKHFGFVTAIDASRRQLMFDAADLLGGLDARRAAEADDGVVTRGGQYVDNRDSKSVRLNLSPDLEVQLRTPCCELHRVSIDDWVVVFPGDVRTFYGTSKSHYELTVDDGEVVAIAEAIVS